MAYTFDPPLEARGSSGDFTVSVEPLSLRVRRPGRVAVMIGTRSGSSPGTLSFVASGLPDGAVATFEPSTVPTGRSARLLVTVADDTPSGIYPLTVTAVDSAGHEVRAYLSLTVDAPEPVGPIGVSVQPKAESAQPGYLAQARVTVRAAETVRLTVSGAPAGARVSCSPATLESGGTSQLWVFTSATTEPGSYPMTIIATAADGQVGTVVFTLTVTGWGMFGG